MVGDVHRRVITCNLDPRVERPELREFTGDPVKKVLADRGLYIAAALTICRAYAVAGRPDKVKPLASFGGWSDTVRSALIWLGEADPVASMEETVKDDPVRVELQEMLSSWVEVLGSGPRYRFSLADIIKIAEEKTHTYELVWPCLHAAIQGTRKGGGVVDAQKLGIWLRSRKNRILGGQFFTNDASKKLTWWVGGGEEKAGRWGRPASTRRDGTSQTKGSTNGAYGANATTGKGGRFLFFCLIPRRIVEKLCAWHSIYWLHWGRLAVFKKLTPFSG
jgi:hypothetical protein